MIVVSYLIFGFCYQISGVDVSGDRTLVLQLVGLPGITEFYNKMKVIRSEDEFYEIERKLCRITVKKVMESDLLNAFAKDVIITDGFNKRAVWATKMFRGTISRYRGRSIPREVRNLKEMKKELMRFTHLALMECKNMMDCGTTDYSGTIREFIIFENDLIQMVNRCNLSDNSSSNATSLDTLKLGELDQYSTINYKQEFHRTRVDLITGNLFQNNLSPIKEPTTEPIRRHDTISSSNHSTVVDHRQSMRALNSYELDFKNYLKSRETMHMNGVPESIRRWRQFEISCSSTKFVRQRNEHYPNYTIYPLRVKYDNGSFKVKIKFNNKFKQDTALVVWTEAIINKEKQRIFLGKFELGKKFRKHVIKLKGPFKDGDEFLFHLINKQKTRMSPEVSVCYSELLVDQSGSPICSPKNHATNNGQ
ncbi:hypothetical protein ECANGB1_1204 [Enterospora canceri]|uniref:Uncharacterized protein n=1 Tax=Enterospora canceri TaxID=1081671 RepID=A0A1Y1S6G2_9MICR|nr:hypothetical protein ECANGB1_1204 [Enterospora canceri]